jgi:potassium efflux system protein
MLRFPALFALLLLCSFSVQGNDTPVSISQIDAAIEQTSSGMDSADPARELLLKTYRDTRALVLDVEKQQSALKAFAGARDTAYEEAQKINTATQRLLEAPAEAVDQSVPLAELEQLILLDKSDLKILQNRLADIRAQIVREANRSVEITKRLTGLGASLPDLEANLKLVSGTPENGSVDEARHWLAWVKLASNRAEKATLDEELLSQPMRLELLAAQKEKNKSDISYLEKQLLVKEQQSSELRQGEAEQVLAAAETAQAKAAGKHSLVQELADKNTVISAALGERSTAIEGVREQELDATTQAEQSERELKIIERKLEILGMSKTVGEILREQAVRLPTTKVTNRKLNAIARLIGDSSLRQMELLDERRELRDVQAYVDGILTGQDPSTSNTISDDLLQLTLSRQELVRRAIEVETTYARALSDLDFSVHRLDNAVEEYRAFISKRLLWVQSRDPLSWSLFSEVPKELASAFDPGLWLELIQWLVKTSLATPSILFLLLLVAVLVYLSPGIKKRISATGKSVGMVRTDSFTETSKSLVFTFILMCKWPLLLLAFALPLAYHETDSFLATALHRALLRTALFYLGLEFMRCLLLPGGLVEAHFRWPSHRVASLNRRVVRFEQIFLVSAFLGVFFLYLYPTDVGGSVGTFAVMAMLFSMAHFFFRMPHFFQGKVDLYFRQPKARIHSFWGTLIRSVLSWAPIAMIIAVFFGYTYTAIAFSTLRMQTVILFTALLLLHELGMRWLRITQRRLRLKVQEELAQANDDEQPNLEDDTLEHDPEMLDDEGTKLLNALLLIGSLVGTALVWSDVFPALGILDSVDLWQRTDTVNGEDLVVHTTLGDAFAALAVGFLGWIAVRRLPGLLEMLLRRKMEVAAASAYAAATIVKYGLTIMIVITVLSMLGGSWSQIQWAVAALSLGIGFGLQEIVANFFSGLIILFEQPIRVGDSITIGDASGVVTKIEMRATTIRDWDRRELLVPNKEFVTGRLLNWSLSDRIIRLHITVGVAYGTDMDKAMAIVRQAAENHPLVLADPEPLVTFDEFGDNSLNISLRYFLEELEQRLPTSSAIRLDISRRFKEAGISVAFPQRDVHLDASAPLDIRLVDTPPSKA